MKLRNNQSGSGRPSTHSVAKITKKTKQYLTVNRRRKINFFAQKAAEMESIIGSPRSENWTRLLVAFIDCPNIDEQAVNSWLDREPTLLEDNAFLARRWQRNIPRITPDTLTWQNHFDVIINSGTALATTITNAVGSHSQDAPPTTPAKICNVADEEIPDLVEPIDTDFTASPPISPMMVGHEEEPLSSENADNSECRDVAINGPLKLTIPPCSLSDPTFGALSSAAPEEAAIMSPPSPSSLSASHDPEIEAETNNSYTETSKSDRMGNFNDVSFSAESTQSSSQDLEDNGADENQGDDGTGEESVRAVPVDDEHEVVSSQHETKGSNKNIPPYPTASPPMELEEAEMERKAIIKQFSSLEKKHAPLRDFSINSILQSSPSSSIDPNVKPELCSYFNGSGSPIIASDPASSSGSSEIDVGIENSPRTRMTYPMIDPTIDFSNSNWTTDEGHRGNSADGLKSFADLRFALRHNPAAFNLILRLEDRLADFLLQFASILTATNFNAPSQ